MYITRKIYWPILALLDVVGSIIFFWKKFKRPPKTIKKVLFIRLEHIGDMIMSTPSFETWKINYPDCKVHVLCKTVSKPVIETNPNVDKIITYDPSWMIRRENDSKNSFWKVARELKKENYDIVFEMHGDPRNNLLAFMTGSYIVGYGCRGAGFLLNRTEKYNKDIHSIKRNLELIKPYCKKITEKMRIYTDKDSIRRCKAIMKKYGLLKNKFIIINPRSGRREKNLEPDEINAFMKKYKNYKILISGSMSEREYNNQFVKGEEKNIINISGKTDLLTLTEIVKNATLVIAPDTGIVHIAKAVGTKCETVYKTTDKKVWGY